MAKPRCGYKAVVKNQGVLAYPRIARFEIDNDWVSADGLEDQPGDEDCVRGLGGGDDLSAGRIG